VSVLRACVHSSSRWVPVFLEAQGEGLRAFPVAPAPHCAPEDIARFSRSGEGGLVLRVDDVIDRVRAARHQINNPLAAALVEVQLLLMDAPDDETRRAVGVVEDQLRKIKALVASLSFPVGSRRQGLEA
jgi:hypothetical protein